VHEGDEGHARPGWTTSRRGQDSPWKSQSEWQRTVINGESTSMVWPTLGSRTAKEQNRTVASRPAVGLCRPNNFLPEAREPWNNGATAHIKFCRMVPRQNYALLVQVFQPVKHLNTKTHLFTRMLWPTLRDLTRRCAARCLQACWLATYMHRLTVT